MAHSATASSCGWPSSSCWRLPVVGTRLRRPPARRLPPARQRRFHQRRRIDTTSCRSRCGTSACISKKASCSTSRACAARWSAARRAVPRSSTISGLYVLDIADARVRIDAASLTTLMNRHTFGYDGAPIDDISVSVADEGRLELKGRLRKGVSVPFSSKATPAATTDGRLQLHVESFKALGVPAKGLLKIFGLELDDLVSLKNSRDIVINDNDIVIAPARRFRRRRFADTWLVSRSSATAWSCRSQTRDRHLRRLVPPDPFGTQLRLLRRRRRPVRQADDEPGRSAAHRFSTAATRSTSFPRTTTRSWSPATRRTRRSRA